MAGELERLGATTVLGVGVPERTAATPVRRGLLGDSGRARRRRCDRAGDGAGVRLDGPGGPGEEAAAVAELEPGSPAALLPEGAEPVHEDLELAPLPEVTRAEPLRGTVVLATGGSESIAGIGTARAADARVLLTGGDTDPRGVPDLVDALSDEPPEHVLALGADFAAEEGLDWKVRTAAAGHQLPGGGQLLFPGRFLVALYGHPGTPALGVLGEQPLAASIQRARDHAAPYEALVDATVVPAFEVIATIASSAAGPDGDYSEEADPDGLLPWVEAAGDAGLYVVLDLQPGRSDFRTQAERYRSLLELPHVGLALDPEWRLGPERVHLQQVGSVGVDEVNGVVTWLADLTRENALPQKLLVLHQFRTAMVEGGTAGHLARGAGGDGACRRPGRPARQAGHLAGPAAERARAAVVGLEELLRRGPADAHPRPDDRPGEPAAAADQLPVATGPPRRPTLAGPRNVVGL